MQSAIDARALFALTLLALTLTFGVADARASAGAAASAQGVGPESDYPMVLGAPFTVDGKTYVPTDTMNYDAVGYAEPGDGGDAVTGTHRTLPLPSYVEVTSLASGKTILVRVTQRGPMAGSSILALSPGALAQLGLGDGAKAAVRVRRVNPPESERATLRRGEHAPDRMETPPGLVNVLKRKLGDANVSVLSESARGAAMARMPGSNSTVPGMGAAKPATSDNARSAGVMVAGKLAKTASKPLGGMPPAQQDGAVSPSMPATAKMAAKPARPADSRAEPTSRAVRSAPNGNLAVQIAAFGSEDRARTVAGKAGAQIAHAGKIWRVRLGPFTDQAGADRALAKARAAGYRDARIVHEP